MAALQNLNFEQAMTLVAVFASMSAGGLWMIGRVCLGMEGGNAHR